MIQIDITHILLALGIPSALTAFFFWVIEYRIQKREKKREKEREKQEAERLLREKNREELLIGIIKSTNASLALSEATAKAVQKIPDAHCNGDMHAALDYAAKIKHEQKEFLTRKGIEAILE